MDTKQKDKASNEMRLVIRSLKRELQEGHYFSLGEIVQQRKETLPCNTSLKLAERGI